MACKANKKLWQSILTPPPPHQHHHHRMLGDSSIAYLALLPPCIFIIFGMKVIVSPLVWQSSVWAGEQDSSVLMSMQEQANIPVCTHPLTDKEAAFLLPKNADANAVSLWRTSSIEGLVPCWTSPDIPVTMPYLQACCHNHKSSFWQWNSVLGSNCGSFR